MFEGYPYWILTLSTFLKNAFTSEKSYFENKQKQIKANKQNTKQNKNHHHRQHL